VTTRLIGGPDLRARLASLQGVGPEFAQTWADDTATRMRTTAPPAHDRRFSTRVRHFRAGVYGAFWWIFVDRGTKAHGPKRAKVLRFERGGETIFAKKVRGVKRRPFVTRAAQEALAGSKWADTVIKQWNRRRVGGRGAFL
jgi:hypothetical protein